MARTAWSIVIVTFAWPSTNQNPGGVVVQYELANGLARRGHEVHFVHGPSWPHRIESIDELLPYRFEANVHHHIVDTLDEVQVPGGDVVFQLEMPQVGLPATLVQGFRMLPAEWEFSAFRARAPKVCVASWLVDIGLEFGVPREQMWHVPLGMNHEIFATRTALDRRMYDVGMLYNPHREKGWGPGYRALQELGRRFPQFRAVVFGHAEPSQQLPDGVEFVRGADHLGLANDVYNECRVFVQSSLHEGFGYTAVEAMACGSALVTTDNGGSRDYAFDGETAVVVPPGNPRAIADAVDKLLRDDEARGRLARAGSEFVRRFDWDHTAEVLEGYLENYLADPPAFQRPPGIGRSYEEVP